MSKTTKEIYLRAFMLLQKDKLSPELREKWFSEEEIKDAIDNMIKWFNQSENLNLKGERLVCCQTTLEMLKENLGVGRE